MSLKFSIQGVKNTERLFCQNKRSMMVGVTGFEPMADLKKHSRLTRCRFVILLVFSFLRLAFSSAGRARLRHLVPHIGPGLARGNGFIFFHKQKRAASEDAASFMVGVTGFEPMASWSRTVAAEGSNFPYISTVLSTEQMIIIRQIIHQTVIFEKR